MAPLWIGLDLGIRPEIGELEHRLLTAGGQLPWSPDHVVTHVVREGVPYAAAAVQYLDATTVPAAADVVHGVVDVLGGTAVALPDGDGDRPCLAGDSALARHCLLIASRSRAGTAGRCVRFPGQARLTGIHPVRRIVERSAITKVAGSGWPVGPDDVVVTRGFLRPVFENGDLVLRVGPAAGGMLIPNEVADPAQCCDGHPLRTPASDRPLAVRPVLQPR